ncbi:DUF1214 domain-containing protein [Flavobacterium endoglycinae]|uniref:DUF1214 domain-containing protein n=1 Tax=Flavobacterium endoglycinae TaxID=2816357 RepID=A0ABX7QLV4_9FLAO|nr:DUF1214 domain-containing protein [Flavobacterium endoglycinae]
MYKPPERFMVPNTIDRYSIINKTKGLKYEANGDLIIYLQSTSLGKDKESNWLPTQKMKNSCLLPEFMVQSLMSLTIFGVSIFITILFYSRLLSKIYNLTKLT